MRNEGSMMLGRVGHSQDAIGKVAKVSRVAVCQWLAGVTKPNPERRDLLFAAYEIPPGSWDEEAKSQPVAPSPAASRSRLPSSMPSMPSDPLDQAAELEMVAADLIIWVRQHQTEQSSPLELGRMISSSARAIELRERILERRRRFFDHPTWRRIEKAIENGLRGHPEAADAVAKALRVAEEGDR